MQIDKDVVSINGQEYVKKGSENKPAETLNGMPYCIVRTYSAGVLAGYVESRSGQEAVIRNSNWDGACGLSQCRWYIQA